VPGLCVPLLRGPFLSFNKLVIDHKLRTCIDKSTDYDLLNPPNINPNIQKPSPTFRPKEYKALKNLKKSVIADVQSIFPKTRQMLDQATLTNEVLPIAAICTRIESLVFITKLNTMDSNYKSSYADLFPADIPHVSELPEDVFMTIKLCDTQKLMVPVTLVH
jgi:hypothetical protein